MLVIEKEAREQLHEAFKHAREIGDMPQSGEVPIPAIDQLKNELRYLDTFAEHGTHARGRTQCRLYNDFSLHSFYFVMKIRDENSEGGYKRWFNGGLIFHGAHDNGRNGKAPSFSENLIPARGWRVHT